MPKTPAAVHNFILNQDPQTAECAMSHSSATESSEIEIFKEVATRNTQQKTLEITFFRAIMGAVRSAFITSRSEHCFPGRDGEHMRLQAFCAFNRLLASVVTCLLALCSFVAPAAWAGPPFISNDPEPVEYHHAGLYIASLYSDNKDGKLATLPHFEFNYGALPDVQLHLIVPFGYVRPNGGPTTYGLADTEVGVSYRFLHMSESRPQIAFIPLMHIPTGDADQGLGTAISSPFCRSGLRRDGGHGQRMEAAAIGSIRDKATRIFIR